MSTAEATTAEHAFHRCAQLLEQLHSLIADGKDDTEEAETCRAEMDPLWYLMSEVEQDRISGLSEDLYLLGEGGTQQVAMSAEDEARWAKEAVSVFSRMLAGGDADVVLKFLRQPAPDNRPRYIIPFLQARCWERLGENELALLFMKEAERLDPRQAVCVLLILERLGRVQEAIACAQRIIANPDYSPEELYKAAAALLRPARLMQPEEARPIFHRIVGILERALKVFIITPLVNREIPDADRYIIAMLGFCHELLGNAKTATRLYNDGLARYPGDSTLLTFRGLALIETDLPAALRFFGKAVQAGAVSMWPYYFLAWKAIREPNYLEAWNLCLRALERSEDSNRVLAQLHEWLGIAMAELGQRTGVLDNFDKARALDPTNEQIRHNWAVAAERLKEPNAGRPEWMLDGWVSKDQAVRLVNPPAPPPKLFPEGSDSSFAALLQSR